MGSRKKIVISQFRSALYFVNFAGRSLKIVIPLPQLKAVNPSVSSANPAEKYIQVVSVDGHEFWYMGLLNYDGAVQCLQEALQTQNLQSV